MYTNPTTAMSCEYYTALVTTERTMEIADTLLTRTPSDTTMLALGTASLYDHTHPDTHAFTDYHYNTLVTYAAHAPIDTPLRISFGLVHIPDTPQRQGFLRITAGTSHDDYRALTLGVEATISYAPVASELRLEAPLLPCSAGIMRAAIRGHQLAPEEEISGVDYSYNFHHLFAPRPEPGTDFGYDVLTNLMPYRGAHLRIWSYPLPQNPWVV